MCHRQELDDALAGAATRPPVANGWRVAAVPSCAGVHVGLSSEGHVSFLVEIDQARSSLPPVRTSNVRFLPEAHAMIEGDAEARATRVAVVECRGADDLAAYFLTLIDAVILGPARPVDADSIVARLGWLVELFIDLSEPSTRSVTGLWGELFIIANSRDPGAALLAWHSDPRELFDFVGGGCTVEVKTTRSRIREHHFLLDQLRPPDGSTGFVVSLGLDETSNGSSIRDLVDLTRARLPTAVDLRQRLESIVASSLGLSWQDSIGTRFALATVGLAPALYRTDAVPTVPLPLPAEVSRVQFVADLSSVSPVRAGELRRQGGLAENLWVNILRGSFTPTVASR